MTGAKTSGPQAFVLGTTGNALGAVRSLARRGVPVVTLGDEKDVAFCSKYGKRILAPNVETQPTGFLDLLLQAGKKLPQPGILFPTGDAYLHFVLENRERLAGYFKIAMPESETMRRLLNKRSQYLLADELGIPLPRTFYPASCDDLREIAGKINYPAVIKASHSIFWRRKFRVQKVICVRSPEELLKGYEEVRPMNIEVMVQEVVLGPDSQHFKICTYMNEKSNPVLIFTLRKIRNFPCHFGVGSVVESVWLPEVAELGLWFLRGVEYVGIGSIEFKRDERDGRLKMIELNPRLWLQNSLADRCGMNFPYTMYRHLAGEPVERQRWFREGVKWVSMRMDYASFRQYHNEAELTYLRWLNSLRGKKVYEVFAWDDLGPFFHATGYGVKLLAKAVKKMTGAQVARSRRATPARAVISKRVLQLISSKGLFGAENVVLQLAKESVPLGVKAFVGVFRNLHSPHTEIAEAAERMKIETKVFSCRGRLDLRTVKEIRQFIQVNNINILHSHGYKANIYGLLASLFTGVRRIATCHTWLGTSVRMRAYQLLDKIFLRSFHKLIAVSDTLKDEIVRSGIPDHKVTVCNNGVGIDDVGPMRPKCEIRKELGIQVRQQVVGTVGRLSREKGHLFLLRAARRVLSAEPNVRFLIVGDGPERESLRAACVALGLQDSVTFTGLRKDIPDLLSVMDVFVLPSFVEGTPMALLEAMAAKRPVVATKVGAVLTVLSDDHVGLLVEPGNVEQLSRSILALLRDREKAALLARNAYARVKSEFTARKMAERYASLYDGLLGTSKVAPGAGIA